MSEVRKHFRKLMEDVSPDYQPPVDPNSGNGLTKFAPTPASKVLKNYTVDHDFLHRALSFGGVEPNAVDQVMQAISNHTGNFDGPAFDGIVASFGGAAVPGTTTSPIAGPSAVAPIVPELPPAATTDPIDDVGVEPVVPGQGAANIAGGAAMDTQADIGGDQGAGDMGTEGGVEAPVNPSAEDGEVVDPAAGSEDDEAVAVQKLPEKPIA